MPLTSSSGGGGIIRWRALVHFERSQRIRVREPLCSSPPVPRCPPAIAGTRCEASSGDARTMLSLAQVARSISLSVAEQTPLQPPTQERSGD